MEQIEPSELAVLPSYEAAMQALKEACDTFAHLRKERDGLAAEKDHAVSILQFETEKHNDFLTNFESIKSNLESNNGQLATLYGQVLATQQSLVLENAKLLKDIEVLKELSNAPFSKQNPQEENLIVTQSLSKLNDSVFKGIRTTIEHQNEADRKILDSLIDTNTKSHDTLNHAMLELARNQATHFRNKLEAVMTMSEALINRLGKSDETSESLTLGKRSSLNNTGSSYEIERLSVKADKLLSENKFLLYVIESFQQKITEKQIDFPQNFLSLEFLLKNRNFLAKSDSPLFVRINDLYDVNERLAEQLRQYKRSSYINSATKGPQSLEEMKNEFRIISEKAKFDQEHELKSISASLAEKIQKQEIHISELQKTIVDIQTSNKNKEAQNQLLANQLQLSETQVERLQEKLKQYQKEFADFVSRVNAQIERRELPTTIEARAINQFYEGVMQSTSTLFKILSQSMTTDSTRQNTSGYVDALFHRLNDENQNLRFELSRKENEVIDLTAEREALVHKIATIEAEAKKEDARELVKDLMGQVQERTAEIDNLKAQFDQASLEHQRLIEEMRVKHQEKLAYLEELQMNMRTEFEAEVKKTHQTFDDRLQEVKTQYETNRRSLETSLFSSQTTVQSLQMQIKNLEDQLTKCQNDFVLERKQLEQETAQSISAIQSQLNTVQSNASIKHHEEVKKLKDQLQQDVNSYRDTIHELTSDHQKEINRLLEQIKQLEHTLEVIKFNRDNLLGVIEHAYINKNIDNGYSKNNFENGSGTIEDEKSNVLV